VERRQLIAGSLACAAVAACHPVVAAAEPSAAEMLTARRNVATHMDRLGFPAYWKIIEEWPRAIGARGVIRGGISREEGAVTKVSLRLCSVEEINRLDRIPYAEKSPTAAEWYNSPAGIALKTALRRVRRATLKEMIWVLALLDDDAYREFWTPARRAVIEREVEAFYAGKRRQATDAEIVLLAQMLGAA
jgi:hypothetical protein